MPDFIPSWHMAVVSKLYVQWVNDGRPIVDGEYVEKILNADTEAMAHLHWMDDIIEFERLNPKSEVDEIYNDLYGKKQ